MLSTQSGYHPLTPLLTISSVILPRKASTLSRILCAPFAEAFPSGWRNNSSSNSSGYIRDRLRRVGWQGYPYQ